MHISISRLTRGLAAASVALLFAGSGCSTGDSTDSTGPDSPNPGPTTPSGSPVPSQLVGGWVYGMRWPASDGYACTGQWLDNAYGTSVMFEFASNGTYRQSLLIKTSVYSCKMQVFIYNEGKAIFDATTIKTYPTKGTVVAHDTCTAANNYTRPDDIAAKQGQRYTWRFGKNADSASDPQTYLILG